MKTMETMTVAALSSIVLMSGPAVSEEKKKWGDQAELSFVDTSGNTDVQTLSLKNKLEYQATEAIKLSWNAELLRGETDGQLSSESYATDLRGDLDYSEKSFVFIVTGWSTDEFSGIDQRYYGGLGLGYKLLAGPKHAISFEGGPNYALEEYTDNTDRDFLEGRVFTEYGYQFQEKSRFSQTLEYLHDFDEPESFNANSETALIFSLTDIFSFKTSYKVEYDNQPSPVTLDKTDTTLSASLGADF